MKLGQIKKSEEENIVESSHKSSESRQGATDANAVVQLVVHMIPTCTVTNPCTRSAFPPTIPRDLYNRGP